jgi:hypothetical protein
MHFMPITVQPIVKVPQKMVGQNAWLGLNNTALLKAI